MCHIQAMTGTHMLPPPTLTAAAELEQLTTMKRPEYPFPKLTLAPGKVSLSCGTNLRARMMVVYPP